MQRTNIQCHRLSFSGLLLLTSTYLPHPPISVEHDYSPLISDSRQLVLLVCDILQGDHFAVDYVWVVVPESLCVSQRSRVIVLDFGSAFTGVH